MKKTMIVVMFAFGILAAGRLTAQSVTGNNESPDKSVRVENQVVNQQAGAGFIDKNGDRICDNRNGRGNRGRSFTDANNDGICDNNMPRGTRGGGRNFADADNNGVCDNFTNGRKGRGFGRGNGKCDGTGRGFRNTNVQK